MDGWMGGWICKAWKESLEWMENGPGTSKQAKRVALCCVMLLIKAWAYSTHSTTICYNGWIFFFIEGLRCSELVEIDEKVGLTLFFL